MPGPTPATPASFNEKPLKAPSITSKENPNYDESVGDVENLEQKGHANFKRLGWKRLTVLLLVEAIALGALSIPSAFAALGMVLGIFTTVGLGFIAIYTSYVVGQVKIKFPQVAHYADAGRLIMGKFGYELIGAMISLQLTLIVGSHVLTGAIAFINITSSGVCSLIFSVVSAIILLIVALPPSFAEVAILGYIDFASIMAAIGVTMIATGISYSAPSHQANWSAWPKEDLGFTEAFIAVTNVIFAYSFAMCQFSFMDEMHTPKDFVKSIWALGLSEIFIYTMTGSLIYVFVGQDVRSPALLSAGETMAKVAFGLALPVIFISGSINSTVAGRYIHGRIYKDSVTRFINTKKGWISWIAIITSITIAAFIIAESIPFFEDLLSLSSALFISGFSYYFPAVFWFMLIKEGKWYERKNLMLSIANGLVFILGMTILVAGTYVSIDDIKRQYSEGKVHGVFSCHAA